MKRSAIFLLTAVAFAFCSVVAGAQQQPTPRLAGVPRVVDGDTLVVSGSTVRINGIDAEELSEPHGRAARAAMQAVVGIGASVSCVIVDFDRYGRAVGVCTNNRGQDVGAEMVRDGHVLDCARFSNGRYRRMEPAGARGRLMQKGYC